MTQTDRTPIAFIVLAAGLGTRMKSDLPKVLHPVAGAPMLQHVLRTCEALSPERIVVVVGPDGDEVKQAAAPYICVVQQKPLGTGDAVKAARKELESYAGTIVVLYADSPLMTADSLRLLLQKREEANADMVVSGFSPKNPASYGRLITDESGNVQKIVEAAEATPEQKGINLCNGGVMLFGAGKLWPLIERLRDDNAAREFYLTDCVALARHNGGLCAVAQIPVDDVLGVNTRVELAQAEKIMQNRLREKAMLAGVTMTHPDSVFLSSDTKFGRDIAIEPNVVIGKGVEIADNVRIRAFSHIELARIERGAIIGPFARLRPITIIGENAHIGNFVEIKNSEVQSGAKINHLSYVGDSFVGEKTNIGAGTITANYDGVKKNHTRIGANVSSGSNAVFIAPVTVGDGALIAAGSVITRDVPADGLAVARAKQENKPDGAKRFRK